MSGDAGESAVSHHGAAGGGILALVLASFLWGTTGTAASFLPDSISPLAVGASTMGIGGALLFLTAPRMSSGAIRNRDTRGWLLLGAIGVVIYPLAFYAGMDLAGVAIGNVAALGSGPIFAAILERAIERRPLGRAWFVSAPFAILGVALLAVGGHGAGGVEPPAVVPGVLLGLLAGAAYALYTYGSSRAIRAGAPSRGAMGAMFGLGAVALIPVLLLTGSPLLQSGATIGIAAYLALGPMFVAYLLFGIGLRTVRSSVATTVTLLEPVIATLLAVIIVGERLTVVGWLGIALVLLGLVVLVSAGRRRN